MKKGKYVLVIGAVVIIVLTSLSSVVGNQTEDSSEKKDSPLFNIRTQRINNKQNNKVVESNYIGKEKQIFLCFPRLRYEQTTFQKVVEKIHMMDDEEFDRVLNKVISKVREEQLVEENQIPEIIQAFYDIRENSEELMKYPIGGFDDPTPKIPSLNWPCTFLEVFIPWCIIYAIILLTLPLWLPFAIIVTVLFGCY